MPKATVTLSVLVTLDVPEEYAGKVSRDDLIEMARNSIPDSMNHPDPKTGLGGCIDGTQVTLDSTCQEDENNQPVFADVFIEHDTCDDPDIEFQDEGFTKAEA